MYVLAYEKCVTYSLYVLVVSVLCRIPFCVSGHLVDIAGLDLRGPK